MRCKRWGYLSLVCASLLCSGCWDATEINQLGIATATGIELVNSQDPHSQARAFVQIASPSQLTSGPDGGGPTGSKLGYVLEEGVGPTAAASLTAVQRRMSRRFFFRDRRVVVIGENFARRGMADLLDAMIRNPDSRFRCYLLIANGCRPGQLLRLSYPLTRLPADAMVELVESNQGVPINAVQFVKSMTGKGDPYAMGIRIIHSSSSTQKGMFELADVAVFKKDRLVGWLRNEAAQGFYWIQPQSNRMRLHPLSVPVPGGGWLTSQLILLNKRVEPLWGPRGPSVKMHLEVSDDVQENVSSLKLDQVQDAAIAQKAIERAMSKQIRTAIHALQHQYGADCLGLGDAFFALYPNKWRQIEGHWPAIFRQLPIVYSVNVHLIRSGISGGSVVDQAQTQAQGR